MADYLLPSERRRRPPTSSNNNTASSSSSKRPPRSSAAHDANNNNRSVRSLRAQWELAGNSVPPAPMRTLTHKHHSGKTELAKYLSHKQAVQARTQAHLSGNSPPLSLKDRSPNGDRQDDKGVNSLISRFNHSNNGPANRFPLAERDLFATRFDDSIQSSEGTTADTFGDLSADHPKTDPGQLENFRRAIQNMGPNNNINVAEVPVTNQQIVRETKAFALAQSNSKPIPMPSLRRSLSAMGVNELAARHTEVFYNYNDAETNENDSDWGAYDKRIQELFSEAQTTAERAVQCDEQEEYGQALDLYLAVVKLYYKVMPFLTPEEALEVDGTVKMYSKRCEVIRQAFQDDYEDESAQLDMGTRVVEREPVHHKQPPLQQETGPGSSHHHHHRVHESHSHNHIHHAPAAQPPQDPRPGARTRNQSGLPPTAPKPSTQENDVALMRNKLPDYDMNEAGGTAIQDAPRGLYGGNAATAAQHRTSLSRPVSKTAIRKATQSMSRERMNEIEEKMRVMRTALHTFTVKRKHLGPARALELMLTTLNVKTFGEMKRLEPLPREAIKTWQSQLEVLLGMLEEIKEDQGNGYRLRDDISRHLPNLKRCDTLVQETMASFGCLKGEIDYVDAESRTHSSSRRNNSGGNTKWWVKHPVVKAGGLSDKIRQTVEVAQKDMETVFKASHEVNLDVIRMMNVPQTFMDGLPKHARQIISKELKEGLMTWGMFRIQDFMKDKKMYNKEQAKELCSALEKVALVWESKTVVKSFLSRTLDTLDIRGERGKNVINALRRCQNAIRDLRREFPTMGPSDLDTAKIAKNEDIGLAGLEAYSRALESRAYRVLTRLREILEVDDEERKQRR